MDFDLTAADRDLRKKLKGLFDSDLKEDPDRLESGAPDRTREILLNWSRALAGIGYLDIGLDDSKNSVALTTAQEVLAALSPPLFLSVEVNVRLFGRLIARYGTEEQRSEILPGLKRGDLLGTVALSERNMSTENNPMETRAIREEGGFRISGSKGHVVNALASDWFAVAGETGDRPAIFLVKRGAEGLSVGKRLPALGYHAALISPVSLEHCRVWSTMGPFENGLPLEDLRTWEDQILTAAALGQMQRAFDAALHHAKTHHSGGKPIIAYQEIGFKLAEMLTLLQTAQLLAYRAAWMAESGDRESGLLVHCAKVFCTESAEKVSSQALQILGIEGFLRGNPAEASYRDGKYLQVAGTSTEISRMKIAENLLRMG
jgi:alkylation response protein AidB-like acyl-CoA dehydrogenase